MGEEPYKRFRAEVAILEKLGNFPGIVPLVEHNLPEDANSGPPWYVMPLATPFEPKPRKTTAVQTVQEFCGLAGTLDALHAKNIAHRDIKPANLMYFNGRLCLSDFGLVKYPGRESLTKHRRDVGAKHTMAPEMRRYGWKADGLPADVHSFAKTLWIALTGEELGFDGQYNTTSGLALSRYLDKTYTTTLDQLLVECTDTDPTRRPTISQVRERLEDWVATVEDFELRNPAEWRELSNKLFPLAAPAQAVWREIDEICRVLNEVAKVPALNHMFYPTGGGMTIVGVSRAAEPGFIELRTGPRSASILRPHKLSYESFGSDARWTYFRLEAEAVSPTGLPRALDRKGMSEELCEIEPGEYVGYEAWDDHEYAGEALPAAARPIVRFVKGSFVLFSTSSAYNRTSSTYDARHDLMTEDQFRDYIRKNAEAAKRM
jgi:serine/threonine-protein kinase